MWFLLLIPLIAFAQNETMKIPKEIEKLYEQMLEKLKDYKPPQLSPQEQEKLKQKVEELQKQTLKNSQEQAKKQEPIKVPQDTVFYVFMSSSVPKVVWEKYMDFVENAKLEKNTFFVLRGCIGGCKFFKPTLQYVQSIQKNRKVQIIIDPFLFRRFAIKEVPCIALVKGDKLFNPELSAGWSENLQSKGKEFLSCGDWAMPYHLKVLCEKSQDPTTCQLAQKYAF